MTFDLGALGAAGLSFLGARNANRATRALAREQMDFQERMSNTSYQRMSEDMRKAGLNPILGLNSGGASSPGGAAAQMQNELSGALSSAVEVRRATAEVENLRAQNAAIRAQTKLTDAQTRSIASELPLKELKGQSVEQVASFAHKVLDKVKSLDLPRLDAVQKGGFKESIRNFLFGNFRIPTK